jgi:4-amino-4-deoxy-L-arabinose transferase-like glycosyltransferase
MSVALPRTRIWFPALFFRAHLDTARLVAFLPLLAILSLQTVVALGLQNTAFQDEANYLYAGRQILHEIMGGPKVYEPYAQYLSGSPYLYPLLAGAVDQIWGLEAARGISLCCMVFTTTAVYVLTKYIYDRDSALLAAALFAVQAPVLFLSHLATYDAMCLALLALAIVLALHADAPHGFLAASVVGAVLLLAVATKYVGVLFVPSVLAILAWRNFHVHGWREALLRVVAAAGVLIVGVITAFHFGAYDAIRSSTFDRQLLVNASRAVLAEHAIVLGGGVIALAGVGLLLRARTHLLISVVLLGSSPIAPAYHVYKGEAVSMPKHIAFGLMFAAPLAGNAITRLSGHGRGSPIGRRWLAGLAVCLLLFSSGLQQAQLLFAEWPNSNGLVHVLRTVTRPSDHILAEEDEVPRYYLQDITAWWQWNHLFWFQYKNAAGRELIGVDAYRAAIADGYFDTVVLRYGPNVATAHAIDAGLRNGKHYILIAKLPFQTTFGTGYYWVWHKT